MRMVTTMKHRAAGAALALGAMLLCGSALAQDTPFPSETPEKFVPDTASFDYVRRTAEIAMRDGVKLHTVILIPKGASHAPMLLTRTPYNADDLSSHHNSSKLIGALDGYDNADDVIVQAGYIRVYQDVRGKYHSEGDYQMNRPLIGPQNPTKVDGATDTYDTIDWLVKNVPESNGRVGTIGISYDGFTTLESLVHPHPALKVAVPMNPMVDGWMGDDWFHRGAFRQLGSINYIYEQEATRSNSENWWTDHYDDYDAFMEAGPGDALARMHGEDQLGFYRKIKAHPAYDAFWQQQAMDKLLAAQKLTVPTLLVHSLWDQEDIYGDIAVWKALKPHDDTHLLYLAMGPWHHGGEIGIGSDLGDIRFDQDTAKQFRERILRPFLDYYLTDNPPPRLRVAPVTAFETGTNHWQPLPNWPAGCLRGCTIEHKKLYLGTDHGVSFDAPQSGGQDHLDYVSDPAKPIPFVPRPIHMMEKDETDSWRNWLVTDQRNVGTRTDVLTFTGPRLTEPLHLAGEPIANLVASTTGTDGDFVVKLIDVYPDIVPETPEMGGFQLMVSADILRGRYRDSYEHPSPIPANAKTNFSFPLPTVNHVFLPGHRVMVQIQSTWFPLYDRNPQTYVDNIFDAKAADYKAATVSVYNASSVDLPVVTTAAPAPLVVPNGLKK